MKKLALAIVLFFPAVAHAVDSAWVQAVPDGYEARVVTGAGSCPVLHTDRGDSPMSVRAAASAESF